MHEVTYAVLLQLSLVQNFESHDELALLLTRKVDMPKLSASQPLANVKVGERPVKTQV